MPSWENSRWVGVVSESGAGRMIIATRNRLTHACLGIDDATVWSIIRDDIPKLLASLTALKQRHD